VSGNHNSAQQKHEQLTELDTYHTTFTLNEGENNIRIEGFQHGKAITEKVFTVFLRSSFSDQFSAPPSGFKKYAFHKANNEKACNPCHSEELRVGAKSKQSTDSPSCYSCHKGLIAKKFVHGPAAVWACSTCHQEDSKKIKNAVADPEVQVCRDCHMDDLAAWDSEEFGHGPTMAGKCAICHNPHGSDNVFFLVKEINDLCLSCHENILGKPHVMVGFSGKNHPVRKMASEGGNSEISCVSCHDPHATNNVYLLEGFKKSKEDICPRCHKFK
jgi:predicted CXXCH cytochrome family protein